MDFFLAKTQINKTQRLCYGLKPNIEDYLDELSRISFIADKYLFGELNKLCRSLCKSALFNPTKKVIPLFLHLWDFGIRDVITCDELFEITLDSQGILKEKYLKFLDLAHFKQFFMLWKKFWKGSLELKNLNEVRTLAMFRENKFQSGKLDKEIAEFVDSEIDRFL